MTFRVGLIGYGFAGRTFHAPLIGATPGLELVAIASSKPEAVRADGLQASVAADAARIVEDDDIDLVVIASPNDSHGALARAALNAGKHVVVDKPFTLELEEARALVALAKRQDRLITVFQNRRWDSDFLAVSEAVRAGTVGQVVHFESHLDRFRPVVRARWREMDGPGAGVWWDLGPHLVDQAIQLFGPPERVTADLAIQRRGGKAPDWAHVLLHYGSHRAVLHASMLAAGGTARFTVHGDRGSLVKARPDQQESQLLAGVRPGAPEWGRDDDDLIVWDERGERSHRPAPRGDQQRFYAELVEALRGTGQIPVTTSEALAVMAVLEAAIQWAKSG